MVHTREIDTERLPPSDGEPREEPGDDEQVTGSLERVGPSATAHDRLAEVRDVDFPIALRGYEREAVDAYVKRVTRLISDLEESRSPDAVVRRALEKVGEETSGILQRAQEAASDITARSRASADDRIRKAEREASALTADAEERVRELEADFGRIWSERDRLLEEVRDLAERLLSTADDASERFPTADDQDAIAWTRDDTASMATLEPGRPGEAELAVETGRPGEVEFGAPPDEADFGEAPVEEEPEAEDGGPSREPRRDEPRPGPR